MVIVNECLSRRLKEGSHPEHKNGLEHGFLARSQNRSRINASAPHYPAPKNACLFAPRLKMHDGERGWK